MATQEDGEQITDEARRAMFRILKAVFGREEAGSRPPVLGVPDRGTPESGGRGLDLSSMIRRSSRSVSVDKLRKEGKRSLRLLAAQKMDEFIHRSVRGIIDKYRDPSTGALLSTQAEWEAESRREFAELLAQYQIVARASEDLAGSKSALHRDIDEMGQDLARVRPLTDGIVEEKIKNAVLQKCFGRLYEHVLAMDRALAAIFTSKLYSYQQIQNLIRSATAARTLDTLDPKEGSLRTILQLVQSVDQDRSGPGEGPVEVVEANDRRVVPFGSMNLELGRGLDIGTVNLCAAAKKKAGGDISYNLQRNAFLDVHTDPSTRKRLGRFGVIPVIQGDKGYVIGDPAFELATLFEKDTRRPMRDGMISPAEPEALSILGYLITQILGRAKQPGEVCAFSIPGPPIEAERTLIYHRSALETVIQNLGYTPRPMLESHLIVLAELREQDYTGIGISCGGGMVNVCVAYKGVPVIDFSTTRAGDWIDGSVASALGVPASLACAVKEGGMNLHSPRGRVEEAVAIYYRNLVQYTLEKVKQKLVESESIPMFTKPIHMISAGGTSMIQGFVALLREEVAKVNLPIEVADIRMARHPLRAVALGCLGIAMEETRAIHDASLRVMPAALERAALGRISGADRELGRILARPPGPSPAVERPAPAKVERVNPGG